MRDLLGGRMVLLWRPAVTLAQLAGWRARGCERRQPLEQGRQIIAVFDLRSLIVILVEDLDDAGGGKLGAEQLHRAAGNAHACREHGHVYRRAADVPGNSHELQKEHALGRGDAELRVMAQEQIRHRHEPGL